MRALKMGLLAVVVIGLAAGGALPAAGQAAAQGACGTAPAPRLMVGQSARVTPSAEGVGNNLRATFTGTATVLGVMPEGEIFTVIGGPQCAENYWWWEIRRWDGQTGWTAEGVTGDYWLELWPAPGAQMDGGDPPNLPGARILYMSGSTGNMIPVTMESNGTIKTPRGSVGAFDNRLVWSPTGAQIAFSDGNDVWIAGEFDILNLTNTPQVNEYWPTWSPDGQRVAYVSDVNGDMEIHARRLDGTAAVNLTNHPARDSWPAWSPDGTRIAFASDQLGTWDIFVMSAADGANPVQVAISNTTAEEDEIEPVWSPDGQRIAYVSQPRDTLSSYLVSNIDVVTLAGGAPVRVNPNPSAMAPAWSPNSQRIAYTGETAAQSGQYAVFTVRVDGSDLLQYTVSGSNVAGVSWSPDGAWLAFADDSRGNFEVYAIRAAGNDLVDLSNNPGADVFPVWSPPGAAVSPGVGVQPTAPAVSTANPAAQDLLLIYDAAVPVFTLQNVSGAALNLTPLSFQGGGITAPAGIWTDFTASPLENFKHLGCLMVWPFGIPEQSAPPECGDARQGWITDSRYIFWKAGSFTVLYNGATVATCDTAAGRCMVDLP